MEKDVPRIKNKIVPRIHIGVKSLKTAFMVSHPTSEILDRRIMNPAKSAVRIALDENISTIGWSGYTKA